MSVEDEFADTARRVAENRHKVCGACGHGWLEHDTDGTGQCWNDTGPADGYCTCLTFSEYPPPAS